MMRLHKYDSNAFSSSATFIAQFSRSNIKRVFFRRAQLVSYIIFYERREDEIESHKFMFHGIKNERKKFYSFLCCVKIQIDSSANVLCHATFYIV